MFMLYLEIFKWFYFKLFSFTGLALAWVCEAFFRLLCIACSFPVYYKWGIDEGVMQISLTKWHMHLKINVYMRLSNVSFDNLRFMHFIHFILCCMLRCCCILYDHIPQYCIYTPVFRIFEMYRRKFTDTWWRAFVERTMDHASQDHSYSYPSPVVIVKIVQSHSFVASLAYGNNMFANG